MWRHVFPHARHAMILATVARPAQGIALRQGLMREQYLARGLSSWQPLSHHMSRHRTIGGTAWRASHLSTDTSPGENLNPNQKQSAQAQPSKSRLADDIKEYKQRVASGKTASFDPSLIPVDSASVFPRIKTTSLSTKRIVIHDEAMKNSVTMVLVAFRSFADDQLQSWKNAFVKALPQTSVQWYDVTINESFGAQALSGFIQRLQRGRTDPALHDFCVAFNSKAREPLEALLPSRNRMFGYVLLLDRQALVRFRASGMATEEGLGAMISCANEIMAE